MFQYFKQMAASPFVRKNAIFFAGSVLVGAANYAYYPVVGRLLDPASFGEVQAMLALFMQLTIMQNVLSQVSVNIVANYDDEARKQRTIFELEKFTLYISIASAIVLALLSLQVKAFLQFSSVWPFLIVLLSLLIGVPLTFRSAYLRAKEAFGLASTANLIGSLGKILCSVLLVVLGFRAAGAIGGIVIAQTIALVYTAQKAHYLGFRKPKSSSYIGALDMKTLRPELKYAALVLIGSSAITLLSSVDIFVVKHFFAPDLAGQYAGISTVAKIIFFLTASVSQVMLPAVKLANNPQQNRILLVKSLGLLCAVGGVATLVFTIFSKQVIALLMGNNYVEQSSLLPVLCAGLFVLSVLNVVVTYYVALRRYQIGFVVLIGTMLSGLLFLTRHATVQDVASNVLFSGVVVACCVVLWRLKTLRATYTHNTHTYTS